MMTALRASDSGSTAVWGSKRINSRPQSCLCLTWRGYPSNNDDDQSPKRVNRQFTFCGKRQFQRCLPLRSLFFNDLPVFLLSSVKVSLYTDNFAIRASSPSVECLSFPQQTCGMVL